MRYLIYNIWMNAFIRHYATQTASAATISTSPACREIHFRAQKYEKYSYKYCIVFFFSRFPMPSELQHISLPDAARCITPRTAVHRPSQRYASAFAPHSPSGATLPPRLPMPSSTQSTRDLSRHQGTFRPISHRVRNIYIMCRKQN